MNNLKYAKSWRDFTPESNLRHSVELLIREAHNMLKYLKEFEEKQYDNSRSYPKNKR